jgi:hypothetical protein
MLLAPFITKRTSFQKWIRQWSGPKVRPSWLAKSK